MNLKLVTWDCFDLVALMQFLVKADTDAEAIRKAMEANIIIGEYDGTEHDASTYTVEDVDFNLLIKIFKETRWIGTYGQAIVLND